MQAARAADSAKAPGKGNPDFLLTKEAELEAVESFEALADQAESESVPRGIAPGAITNEDREIELMLERQAKTNPIQDLGPEMALKPEIKKRDVLRNHVEEYKPASSLIELQEQVHHAKSLEIDSIEATPQLLKHIFKRDFDHIRDVTGYAIYHDIRVYIDGFFEKNKDADSLTMEQKLHPKGAGSDTVAIIRPQRI